MTPRIAALPPRPSPLREATENLRKALASAERAAVIAARLMAALRGEGEEVDRG